MNKPQLIRLIHIAKSQLKLDDDTYRVLLANTANGKTSCSVMSYQELQDVYSEFQQRGFKRRFKKPTPRVKPNSKGLSRAAEIPKIRAVWNTMFLHGFVGSDDELALNAYVKRMALTLFAGWYVVAVWCGAFISGFVIFAEFTSSLSFKHVWQTRLFDCGIGTISGVCLQIAIWVGWHFIGWVSLPIAVLGFIAFPLFRKTIKYWGALWIR
ncbi:gp16 family protein [Yersinia bercovieri]|uniref:gp16 family protein n=1 Tax=Yersinia bercovieri TaxID=634 RepID=UPI00119E46E3|nr:regulatory protein GemA [Yersinia bercovieri]